MALFSVLKYEGPNDVLVWKAPQEDFNTKSQLIVHESQEAVFFKDGQALDLFGAGRHTLETQNIPLLSKLINLPFGKESPFHCEVYFVNKTHSMDIRWGTSNHIPIQDPVYGVILPIGANGQFGVQVEDSRKLLVKLVGTIPAFTQVELVKYFRGLLMTNIKDFIAKKMTQDKLTFLEIHAHLKEISDAIAQDLQAVFQDYGIKLINFFVGSIIVPEDDPSYKQLRDALARKAEMGVLGYTYQQQRTFDVLEGAAKNEGGGAAVMGAGMGLGMGVNLGGFMGQAMGQNINGFGGSSSGCTCVRCGAALRDGVRFCSECGAEQVRQSPGTVRCPNCGEMVPSGKFCAACGGQLQRFCPECGTAVASGNFCPNCGKKLGG
ncbi:MAG: SPFH domain-containing protein [Clostridiales bacterium]|nr:SPFH domain-containing protein [Clostridiales bacterium]